MPASPDPDLALRLAKSTADLYGQATEDLLAIVARRVARGIDQPGWAERKLAETARLRDNARAVVDRLTAAMPAAVAEGITGGWVAGELDAAADLAGGPIHLAFGVTNTRAVDALVGATVSQLERTHGQILRSTLDAYREVIAETGAPQVLAGVISRQQAAQRALDRFADRGITGFVDSAGRKWELEAYTEMATRTAVGRAQVAGALDRFQSSGRDLVIVSDATQECEVCRRWEGKVLSISGDTPTGTRTGGFTVAGTVAEAQRAGLHHPNCRHRLGAFIPGLTERMTDTEDPEGDAQRQEQRRLERGVRYWKRREAVAVGTPAHARAAARRHAWQDRLTAHIDEHDLKRIQGRESSRLLLSGPPLKASTSTKVNSLLRPGSAVARNAQAGLDAAAGVHDLPDVLRVVVHEKTGVPAGKRGHYWPPERSIGMHPDGNAQALTFVHELGHAIEDQAAGLRTLVNHPQLNRALEGSPSVQALRAIAEEPGLGREDRAFLRYLLDPAELWARAYSQWVVTRSGNPSMLRQAEESLMLPMWEPSRYRQWPNDEFEPIAEAIDTVMRELGLLA